MSDETFLLKRPPGLRVPLVVDVPHAGIEVPPEARDLRTLPWDDLNRDCDRFVDELWDFVPAAGGTLIVARFSRYGLDLNRGVDEADGLAVEGRAGQGYPRGIVWRVDTDGRSTLAAPLRADLFAELVDRYWRPYHAALEGEIASVVRQFGYAILVAAHSMPSVGKANHSDPGRRRADVVPGNNFGKSCATRVTAWVCEHFTDAGMTVALNDPYAGGYTTRRYGKPAEAVHAIQIELNRASYLDEATLTLKDLPARRLKKILETLVAALPSID